jgi:WD40 repeat protein
MPVFNSFFEIIFKRPFASRNVLSNTNTEKKYILQQLNLFPKIIVAIIISYDYHFEGINDQYSCFTLSKTISYFSPRGITVIPNGHIAVASSTDIRILNPKNGNQDIIYTNSNFDQHIYCIVGFTEGILIGRNNALGIWNYKTNEFKFISFANTGIIFDIVVISNELVCMNCRDTIVRVYNLKTAQFEFMMFGHTDIVSCIAVIHNKYIISGSWDKTIRFWDIKTGVCKYILSGVGDHSHCIKEIVVISDEEPYRLVSYSTDNTIMVWRLRSNGYYNNYFLRRNENNYGYAVAIGFSPNKYIAVLPDKKLVFVKSRCIQVWNLENHEYHEYESSKGAISTVISKENLITATFSGYINIWK